MNEKIKELQAMCEGPDGEVKLLSEEEMNQISGGGVTFRQVRCRLCGEYGIAAISDKKTTFTCRKCGTFEL